MKRIEIDIKLVLEMPDHFPSIDFVRACGNYLCDALPAADEQARQRTWKPGREVTITSEIEFKVNSDRTVLVEHEGKWLDISDL